MNFKKQLNVEQPLLVHNTFSHCMLMAFEDHALEIYAAWPDRQKMAEIIIKKVVEKSWYMNTSKSYGYLWNKKIAA